MTPTNTKFPLCAAIALAALACGAGANGAPPASRDWDVQRGRMVDEQLKARDIRDARVLDVLRKVPRHLFVPEPQRAQAYIDSPLPIGHGQTISQPYIVAFMTQALDVRPGDSVLEIGTGSGYQAAVLGELAKSVYTIEIVAPLADRARATLKSLGYKNIQVRTGNGYLGWPEHAPFDRIMVTAAPDEVPPALVQQLKIGGLMAIPVGTVSQELRILRRTETGTETLGTLPVRFVPMTGKPKAEAPAMDVRPWKPAGISSPRFESHAAFDPRNRDLYFVRSSPQFTGWRILVSQCTDAGWSKPLPPSFAGDGVEADPYFTSDGRSLYFISTRSEDGVKQQELDIWKVDRDEAGAWGTPKRLPEPVNSSGAEWFPRPAADGWLYFGSDRPGGVGATDIWRARLDADRRWTTENLGPTVNTAGDDYEPQPAPDGSRLILMADGGLYETRKTPTGWAPRTKLGPDVTQNGTEIGPVFSPSGRSLLFSRDTKGPDSGEFFVWYADGPEAWPPECPARR